MEKVPRVMKEKTAEVIGCVESVVEYDVYTQQTFSESLLCRTLG